MITRADIDQRVREWGLREDVVEKDYVIGWLLWGIGSDPTLGEKWAFKGGTSLKKCYIETYRFSEDLDFTVLPDGPITPADVEAPLKAALDRVAEESGIDFSQRAPMLKGHASGKYTEGRIYYVGPRRTPHVASVKLDLSSSEKVVRSTVQRPIAHPYPDSLPEPGVVRCYSFEEVFAEKIRALGERGRPRDLYDVINLFRREDHQAAAVAAQIRAVLTEKCQTKGVPMPTLASVQTTERLAETKSEWENMLRHQLPELPPFDDFWNVLPEMFAWLEGTLREPVLQPLQVAAEPVEVGWSPPPTVSVWGGAVPLETVRFAAANRLCVELGYNGSRRVIEPYSLRRSRAGNLLLYAVRADNGEPRAYRVDRIESVRVTQRTFTPRYRVEFVSTGGLHAPPLTTRPVAPPSFRSSRSTGSGVVYIIECPYCHKRFRRSQSGEHQLNEHKAPGGYRCSGSGHRGYLVDTEYR
ncbi:MAG: nucleotidyl transferase AbiEii/AbiGii toxin family protein [Phycisphaerales bacterium]|nr:nucleotidyl transferase AbiEii/AbiGii toxin family protein [Phycisphaerales bacterium]